MNYKESLIYLPEHVSNREFTARHSEPISKLCDFAAKCTDQVEKQPLLNGKET
jgi:hypothetical protein